MQQTIDNSILKMLHKRKVESGEVSPDDLPPNILSGYRDYPGPLDRLFKNMETMSTFGAYYFSLGPLITFMVLLQEISKEKELKLR